MDMVINVEHYIQCFIIIDMHTAYILLAASTAVSKDLSLDEKTMPHVHVIVSRI